METDIIQFLMLSYKKRETESVRGVKKKNPAYIFSSATIATLDIVSAI